MQLQNAIASLDAPLQYPPNVVVGPQFPTTKQHLLKLSGKHVTDSPSLDVQTFTWHLAAANAQVVSQALGLPALPPNSHLAAHQQQIIDFLGCAMRA